jgi:phosphoenolpyruvate carboxykinase (ATP)
MLGQKIKNGKVKVWLVNTGWTGGPYLVGNRIRLSFTRSMVSAALEGKLDTAEFHNHPIFGIAMPVSCPGMPYEILNPINTWADKEAYNVQAKCLATKFIENFKHYESGVSQEIFASAPNF